MDFIKKYKVILLILLPVVILVLIRSLGTNHFQSDARKHAEASFSGSNILTPEKASQLEGNKLLIIFGKDVIKHNFSASVKSMSPDSVLSKENISLILKHDGPVILSSDDIAVAARVWMILSQMGSENLYVLSDDPQPEVLKYEFRPDTMARPEL
jgi:hypothetical protein